MSDGEAGMPDAAHARLVRVCILAADAELERYLRLMLRGFAELEVTESPNESEADVILIENGPAPFDLPSWLTRLRARPGRRDVPVFAIGGASELVRALQARGDAALSVLEGALNSRVLEAAMLRVWRRDQADGGR